MWVTAPSYGEARAGLSSAWRLLCVKPAPGRLLQTLGTDSSATPYTSYTNSFPKPLYVHLSVSLVNCFCGRGEVGKQWCQ